MKLQEHTSAHTLLMAVPDISVETASTLFKVAGHQCTSVFFTDGTSLGDSNAYDVIKYTYEDEYEVAVMNADEKATLTHLKGTTDTPPTGAVIIEMGDCKEQRAFLYADVTSIASNHIAGSRQSESQPTSRRPSFSYQITKPSVQILRMNSQSDLAQRLAQLIKVENRHESL